MRVFHLPSHRVTTAHLGAAYPFLAAQRLEVGGVYLGQDLLSGEAFCFDAWELYQHGLITGPNVAVLGMVGRGKSALVKSYVHRQVLFGRRAWMIDPKGETGPLCRALGAKPVRLRPGGEVRLNPLDPLPGLDGGDAVGGQPAMLAAIAEAALRRGLTPPERTACELAIRAAGTGGRVPTLPAAVQALLDPSPDLARSVASDVRTLAADGRHVALELRRLCDGDLRGMFDGPTSQGLDLAAPVVALDLSAVYHSDALAIVMACATGWLRGELLRRDGVRRILVIDEAWLLLRELGIARWLQSSWKLAREYGVQGILVAHRASDLSAAGPGESEQAQLARGLLSDSETRVIYGQPPDELDGARELFGLSAAETDLVGRLRRGVALWKVGRRSYLVEHRLAAAERPLVDTDARTGSRG